MEICTTPVIRQDTLKCLQVGSSVGEVVSSAITARQQSLEDVDERDRHGEA